MIDEDDKNSLFNEDTPELSAGKNDKAELLDVQAKDSVDMAISDDIDAEIKAVENSHIVVQGLEAILFAAGDPVSKYRLMEILDLDEESLLMHIENLQNSYAKSQHGIEIRRIGDSYAFATKVEVIDVLDRFFQSPVKTSNLSQAAYETLAVVAYNEPITRAQIDQVRGVNSDASLNRLLEKGLVEMTGSLDLPGRPSVFSTTELFLRLYGISTLDELEPMDMLMYDTVQDFEKSYRKTQELAQRSMAEDTEFVQEFDEKNETKDSGETSVTSPDQDPSSIPDKSRGDADEDDVLSIQY